MIAPASAWCRAVPSKCTGSTAAPATTVSDVLQSQVFGSARAQSASASPLVGNGTSRQGSGEPGTSRMVVGRHEGVAESPAGELAGDLEDEPPEVEDRRESRPVDRPATTRSPSQEKSASRG